MILLLSLRRIVLWIILSVFKLCRHKLNRKNEGNLVIMIIAIEGVDGTGKTSVATALAKQLNFAYVEKPFQSLVSSKEEYLMIKKRLNEVSNRDALLWFYGMGNVYLKAKHSNDNVVADRYLLSNYSWLANEEADYIFDAMVKTTGVPELTVLLTADVKTVSKRLIERNGNEKENYKTTYIDNIVKRMDIYIKRYKMPVLRINSASYSIDEIVDMIKTKLKSMNLIGE